MGRPRRSPWSGNSSASLLCSSRPGSSSFGPSGIGSSRHSPRGSAIATRTIPLVASILADYGADRPDVLAETIADAGPSEFVVLLASRWTAGPQAAVELQAALAGLLEEYPDGPNDLDAARIANTAIALLRLGRQRRGLAAPRGRPGSSNSK